MYVYVYIYVWLSGFAYFYNLFVRKQGCKDEHLNFFNIFENIRYPPEKSPTYRETQMKPNSSDDWVDVT